jgi:Mg2+ and Co2+ transporter CorA
MIPGIEGMNLRHMPEPQTTWGHRVVLGTMLAVCGVLHRGVERDGRL